MRGDTVMHFRLSIRIVVLGVGIATVVVAAAVALVLLRSEGGGGILAAEESNAARITVEEVVNQVETNRRAAPGPEWGRYLPAQVGQDLSPGDGVNTFRDSQARVDIVIRDLKRIIRTTPSTLWRLGHFESQDGTIIELNRGKIFLIEAGVDDGVSPVEVVTPAGTASPRGTWMSVSYDPEMGVTETQCYRGICVLENQLGQQVMTDEEKGTSTAQSAPSKPRLMTEAEKLEFLKLPEVQSEEVVVPTLAVDPPTPTPLPPLTGIALLARTKATEGVFATFASMVPAFAIAPSTPVAQRSAEAPNATLLPAFTKAPSPHTEMIPTLAVTIVPPPTAIPTPRPPPTLAPAASPVPLPSISSQVLPHLFLGSVMVDGKPVEDGMPVTAWIKEFEDPVGVALVNGGTYSILIAQYGAVSFSGKELIFKLVAWTAQEKAVWQSGAGDELNLTAHR